MIPNDLFLSGYFHLNSCSRRERIDQEIQLSQLNCWHSISIDDQIKQTDMLTLSQVREKPIDDKSGR